MNKSLLSLSLYQPSGLGKMIHDLLFLFTLYMMQLLVHVCGLMTIFQNNICKSLCVFTGLAITFRHMESCVYMFSRLPPPYIFPCANPGPFHSTLDSESALNQIAEHRSRLEALKQEESSILHELGFFKIEQPTSKSIRMLEKV